MVRQVMEINNLFSNVIKQLVSVRISSYGCTREVTE